MTTFVPLLTTEQIEALPVRAREVVEYRKSGLSLNHVQGCPLDCAYCIRHTYGVWDMRQPRAVTDDASAVRALVEHPYFQPDVTPIQVFNRATDPMLPRVKNHVFAVLADLDARGLRNHVLVITRYRMTAPDCQRLNELVNVKLTLLFTYSGIDDTRIEPYPSHVAEGSLRLASAHAGRYRTILYWRPLVPGLNDTPRHLAHAVELSKAAHAHGVYRPVLPRRDRRLLPGQRPTRTLRGHRPPQDRASDPGTARAGRLRPRRRWAAVPQDELCRVVRPRAARLQRALRHPGAVRHLPAGAGGPVLGGAHRAG